MWQRWVFLLAVLAASSYCYAQSQVNYIGENLGVQFQVISNLNGNADNFGASITLTNEGPQKITQTGDWKIYFYSLFKILSPIANDFEFNHVNGILFTFNPTANFAGIEPGNSHVINLVISFWTVSRSDVMPRWYVASETDNERRLIASTTDIYSDFVAPFDTPETYKRYADDLYMPFTPEYRFDRYDHFNSDAAPKRILPTPVKEEYNGESITLYNTEWSVDCGPFQDECNYLKEYFGIANENEPEAQQITFSKADQNVPDVYQPEAYKLTVSSDSITIEAQEGGGAFYAIQSLISLASAISTHGNTWSIPQATIQDGPRYEYRGMHLDVARNFVQKEDVITLLKAMAMYKLNNFHFHLTDDEGWRVQMDFCPELHEIGGKRAHDLSETKSIIPQLGSGPEADTSGTGYYTREDYREILTEANKLHIRVIPEIDLPGHAHAAIKANLAYYRRLIQEGMDENEALNVLISDLNDTSVYESVQLFTDNAVNPCVPGTYTFVYNVTLALIDLHTGVQALDVLHLGGDEIANAWTNSSACEKLYNTSGFPHSHDDLLEHFMTSACAEAIEANPSLKIGLWEDGALDGNTPLRKDDLTSNDVLAYAWQNIWEWGVASRAYKLANAGYKVVISHATHLYFDQPYEPDPEERGLYWASRFTEASKTFRFMPDNVYENADVKRSGEPFTREEMCKSSNCTPLTEPQNIIGIQGHLFSETVRSKENFNYMVFPRLLALAERAWHKASWEATQDTNDWSEAQRDDDWSSFAASLSSKELARLAELGIEYRLTPPGVKVTNGEAKIACEYPGMPVRYRDTSSSENQWQETTCGEVVSVSLIQEVEFQTKDNAGTRFSRSVFVSSANSVYSTGSFKYICMALGLVLYKVLECQ